MAVARALVCEFTWRFRFSSSCQHYVSVLTTRLLISLHEEQGIVKALLTDEVPGNPHRLHDTDQRYQREVNLITKQSVVLPKVVDEFGIDAGRFPTVSLLLKNAK